MQTLRSAKFKPIRIHYTSFELVKKVRGCAQGKEVVRIQLGPQFFF